MTPVWIDKRALLLLDGERLAEHGAAAGLDEGLLESVLARPVNLAVYEAPDIAALAASYGVAKIMPSSMPTSVRRFSRPACFYR